MKFSTKKSNIIFYEKTGCAGNSRQKKVLKSFGIRFEVKSLLETNWDIVTLEPFFKNIDKTKIVNLSAPKIKNNDIDISFFTKNELIKMMCDDPILIKRPLIQIDQHYICGFDIKMINDILNTSIKENIQIPTCLSSDKCTTAS